MVWRRKDNPRMLADIIGERTAATMGISTEQVFYYNATLNDKPYWLKLDRSSGLLRIVSGKKVGVGEYEDYHLFAKYAANNFLRIPKELANDISADWHHVQRNFSQDFYNLFCSSYIQSQHISEEQARQLAELIAPLMVEHQRDS